MERNSSSSNSSVCIKDEVDREFNECVRVEAEVVVKVEHIKEEDVWDDGSSYGVHEHSELYADHEKDSGVFYDGASNPSNLCEDYGMKEDGSSSCSASQLAPSELYAGHQIKDELVLGPECLQPPDIAFKLLGLDLAVRKQHKLRDCVVKLKRIDFKALRGISGISNRPAVIKVHKCFECDKWYILKESLSEHVRMHPLYNCPHCPLSTTIRRLYHHLETVHFVSELVKHVRLGTVTRRRARPATKLTDHDTTDQNDIHINGRTDRDYVCDICQWKFDRKAQLREHIAVHIHFIMEENSTQVHNDEAVHEYSEQLQDPVPAEVGAKKVNDSSQLRKQQFMESSNVKGHDRIRSKESQDHTKIYSHVSEVKPYSSSPEHEIIHISESEDVGAKKVNDSCQTRKHQFTESLIVKGHARIRSKKSQDHTKRYSPVSEVNPYSSSPEHEIINISESEEEIDVVSLGPLPVLPSASPRRDSFPAELRRRTKHPAKAARRRPHSFTDSEPDTTHKLRQKHTDSKRDATKLRQKHADSKRDATKLRQKRTDSKPDATKLRQKYNDSERFRRVLLKHHFDKLQDQLPSIKGKRGVCKRLVLCEATALCVQLQEEQRMLENLKKQLIVKCRKLKAIMRATR